MLPLADGRRSRGLAVLLLASALAGADAAAQALVARDFRTPDGTRVILLPMPGPPVFTWAVASPIGPQVDPAAAPGLAAACALASMRGTWLTGSLDATSEREALAKLDAAEVELALAPRIEGQPPTELAAKVQQLAAAAAALSDRLAFRRVLMGSPVQDPRIDLSDNCAVLTLTTRTAATRTVARLLLERREEQALRGFRADFETLHAAATRHWDSDLLAPLRAEVLALAYPGSPLARSGDRPTTPDVSRALAETTWANSQAPSRTLHVLAGNFDSAAVEGTLQVVFRRSFLPDPTATAQTVVRGGHTMRRAVLPGASCAAAVIAWPMVEGDDATALQCLARWFASGSQSWLARELQRLGRKQLRITGRAAWPTGTLDGMFVVEVADTADDSPKLADQILAICATQADLQPRPKALAAAHGSLLAEWQQATGRPAALVRHYAAQLLQQPRLDVPLQPPHIENFAALPAMLHEILARQPIVVEWSDS